MWPLVLTVAGLLVIAAWLTFYSKRSSATRRSNTAKFRGRKPSFSSTVIDNRQILYPLPVVNVVLDQIIQTPTNTPQTFTAPSGANFLSVYINGGGGGGGNGNIPGNDGSGGGGSGIATVINHPITSGVVYTAFIDGSTGLTNPANPQTNGINATLTVGVGGVIMNIQTTGGQSNNTGTNTQGGNAVATVDGTILPTQTGGNGSDGTVYTATNIRLESGGGGGAVGVNGFNASPFVGGNNGSGDSGGGGASGLANGGNGGGVLQNGFPGTGLGAGGGGAGINVFGSTFGGIGGLAQIRFLFTKNAIYNIGDLDKHVITSIDIVIVHIHRYTYRRLQNVAQIRLVIV